MISISAGLKNALKQPIKELLAYITDGTDEITQNDDIASIELKSDGNLCKTVMREVNATYFGTHDYNDKDLNIGFGTPLLVETDEGEVTISISTPTLITKTSHGHKTGDMVQFSTTGALPTGLAINTDYFVIKVNDNTFNLASSYINAFNNVKVNTSGTQSGTQSMTYFPVGEYTTPEYIDYGSFRIVPDKTTVDQATGETTVKMYDKMYQATVAYDLTVTYPTTVLELLQAIRTRFSWTLATTSFPNDSFSISSEPFANSNLTYRDVLDQIAEATGSIIYFDTNDELVVRQVSLTSLETLDDELLSFTPKSQWGELNSVVLARTPQEDNIVQKDDASIATNGLTEFRIENNLIVDADRETAIGDIYTALHGIKYYPFDSTTQGLGYFEIGDMLTLKNPDGDSFDCLVLSIDITVSSSMTESLSSTIANPTSTNYGTAGVIGQRIKNTELKVDKVQGEIDIINTALESVASIPRQSTAPESPNTNDLWLDTDDNIIYIWDGSAWQATAIAPSTLTDYYTREETDAQIQVTNDQITQTVSETYSTKVELDERATSTEGLVSNLADSLASTQEDVVTNQTAIETVNESISTLTQDISGLSLTVTQQGGANLLRNSCGLKGTIAEWQVFDSSGTLADARNNGTIDQTSSTVQNTESGSGIKLINQYIEQTIATLIGNVYTVYLKFKKNTTTNLTITGVQNAIEITAGDYVDETWAVFKYQFTATSYNTIVKIEDTNASNYCIIADAVVKIGDCNGWTQAQNEMFGKNFKMDKDGLSITDTTTKFKSVLNNVQLGLYDTSSGSDKTMALFNNLLGLITDLTVQDYLTIQRYGNSSAAARFLPVSTGLKIVIND